jgi:membrane-bound lytic murein transglycosylase B
VGGVTFWNNHAEKLERARKEYGLPEEIVTAVIGVETIYGAQTGKYRVLDALVTLAFDYPRRSEFFREELEQYLLLMREQGADVLKLKGSYAGAIGIPQFMPSSYRRYAVDFDGDNRKELLQSPADAIGSVANYLKMFGWEQGQPVAVRAQISSERYQEALAAGIKPSLTLSQMKQFGVTPLVGLSDLGGERMAALFVLEGKDGPEYWLGFNNFYVITRYNRSTYYAMSVWQLAEEIHAARNSINDF